MRRQNLRRGLILVSFLLMPVTLYWFSPALILEAAAAGLVSGSALVFGSLFVGSLFFGRAWCGWACPGAGLQEACAAVSPRPAGRRRWVKYLIFVPWLAAIVLLALKAGGFRQVQPLYAMPFGTAIADPRAWIIYFGFVTLIVALAFLGGRRAFCHYACWMAPFMILGTRLKNRAAWPALRLEAEPARCNGCRTCTKNCPMSLDVEGMVKRGSLENSDCVLCGECVDGCRRGAIRYAFHRAKATELPVRAPGSPPA
ncbi:MAG: 4Fe-4S binding protein [Methanocella sp.]